MAGDRLLGVERLALGDLAIPPAALGVARIDQVESGRILVKYSGEATTEEWSEDTIGIGGTVESYDHFGSAVVAGDFNGDGYDDVAISVPDEDIGITDDSGSVHVIYGSPSGLTADADQLWTSDSADIKGVSESGDRFG